MALATDNNHSAQLNMKNKTGLLLVFILALWGNSSFAQNNPSGTVKEDLTAENMLLWQRSYGGWPKDTYNVFFDDTKGDPKDQHPEPVKVLVNYHIEQTAAQKALALASKDLPDATNDNEHTVKEIRYLLGAYKTTANKKYLDGAEKGIAYLLKAQFPTGGWPMFYPDKRIYKGYITYNDNNMGNVMNLMFDLAHKINNTDALSSKYVKLAQTAFDKGLEVILKTQISINGKKAVWCAQHDPVTLLPVKARSYELPSLSGSESVGIVEVLMRVENPSVQVKQAIKDAMEWFDAAKIAGYKTERIKDATQPKGLDVVVVPDAGAVIWARFYDLDTNKPYFCDRDGIKKQTLAEIGNERRTGYSWYGTWPEKLISTEYPAWKKKWAE
jgi:PelA/Pel-15E family pectate lyase